MSARTDAAASRRSFSVSSRSGKTNLFSVATPRTCASPLRVLMCSSVSTVRPVTTLYFPDPYARSEKLEYPGPCTLASAITHGNPASGLRSIFSRIAKSVPLATSSGVIPIARKLAAAPGVTYREHPPNTAPITHRTIAPTIRIRMAHPPRALAATHITRTM